MSSIPQVAEALGRVLQRSAKDPNNSRHESSPFALVDIDQLQ